MGENEGAIQVLTAGALKEGTLAAAVAFEQGSGTRVTASYTHGHDICRDMLAGTVDPDVVGLPIAMIRELQEHGRLVAPPLPIGQIGIAAAVQAGDAPPGIADLSQFIAAVRDATALIYTTAPSGEHMASVFAAHGLTEELAGKTVRFSSGAEVNDYLAGSAPRGSLAFGVTTEIKFYRDKGVAMVGLLPREIEDITPYEMAVSATSRVPDDARAFLEFLTTPDIAAVYAQSGVS